MVDLWCNLGNSLKSVSTQGQEHRCCQWRTDDHHHSPALLRENRSWSSKLHAAGHTISRQCAQLSVDKARYLTDELVDGAECCDTQRGALEGCYDGNFCPVFFFPVIPGFVMASKTLSWKILVQCRVQKGYLQSATA